MKTIDVRLTADMISWLQATIGQTFIKFRSDPFRFDNSVFEFVGLFLGDHTLLLSNSQHVVDYFGSEEEIVLLELHRIEAEDIHSGLVDVEQTDTQIERKIKEIHLVQENQKLYENGELVYDVHLTRGIIFVMEDGYEVSFEKDNPFVETIVICRGENLIEQFTPKENAIDDLRPNQTMTVDREIQIIS